MNTKPRFFCDNCESEVDQDSKACPVCGRSFSSVRCPSCGFTADEDTFKNGCPSCGYSADPSAPKPAGHSAAARTAKKSAPKGASAPMTKLPLWVYIVSICAFIAVCVIFIYRFVLS